MRLSTRLEPLKIHLFHINTGFSVSLLRVTFALQICFDFLIALLLWKFIHVRSKCDHRHFFTHAESVNFRRVERLLKRIFEYFDDLGGGMKKQTFDVRLSQEDVCYTEFTVRFSYLQNNIGIRLDMLLVEHSIKQRSALDLKAS